jgi:hypothetical protein
VDIGWDGETPQTAPIDVVLRVKSTHDEAFMQHLDEFARLNGIAIGNVSAKTNTVHLLGTAGQWDRALFITLNDFSVAMKGARFRDFMDKTEQGGMVEGRIRLPDNLAANIVDIAGLDTTPEVIPPGAPLPPG